jgi:hypothetical protein
MCLPYSLGSGCVAARCSRNLESRSFCRLCLFVTLQWPGCLDAVKPPNAGLKLFGGAAFERCLNEFQVAANMLAFPSCESGFGLHL